MANVSLPCAAYVRPRMSELSSPSCAQAPRGGERPAAYARPRAGTASQSPAISIVLPVHNGEAFLAAALESILSQSFADFELIAVDDMSSDASPEILAAFSNKDSRVRVITLDTNAKLPGALNAGFARARADWLSWTSDDNLLHPDMFAALLAARDRHPDADVIHAGYRVIDANGVVVGRMPAESAGNLLERNVVGCCFLYRRAVDESLGGYDEALFGAEDYDFWLRAERAGFRFHALEQELYDYRRHDRSLTDRRWYENRRRVERILEREIVLAGDRNRRARAWLALFLGNPHELRLRYLLRALREDPGMVASRPGDLLGWLRRAVAWRIS